jgi:hypothetical protein
MKHPIKADSFDVRQSGAIPDAPRKRPIRKRSKKPSRDKKKFAEGKSEIRETQEARALLEDQLHSLYWWVFNASKMKGFIRAKALDELQRAAANASETRAEDRVLPAKSL